MFKVRSNSALELLFSAWFIITFHHTGLAIKMYSVPTGIILVGNDLPIWILQRKLHALESVSDLQCSCFCIRMVFITLFYTKHPQRFFFAFLQPGEMHRDANGLKALTTETHLSSPTHANCFSLVVQPSVRPPGNMMCFGLCPGHSIGGHFSSESAWNPRLRIVLEGHTDLEHITLQRSYKTNVHFVCGQCNFFFRVANLVS